MSSAQFDFDYEQLDLRGEKHLAIKRSDFDRFKSYDLGESTERFEAITAFFDLEGFTAFYDTGDAHLRVNSFVDAFQTWIFEELVTAFSKRDLFTDTHAILWDPLPVFWKPTGDGGFFIWRLNPTTNWKGNESAGNIIWRCHNVVLNYRSRFLPSVSGRIPNPPGRIRCGMARGVVYPLANGLDYVAPSINTAAHLQKLRDLQFYVRASGLDPAKCFLEPYRARYVTKSVALNGDGRRELVLVDKQEFEQLPDAAKARLIDPIPVT